MEDFIEEIQALVKGPLSDRVLGLQMFIRRLIHLNHEKVQVMIKKMKTQIANNADQLDDDNNDLYQTLDKEKMSAKLMGQKQSRQVLSEIRSELQSSRHSESSYHYESQS